MGLISKLVGNVKKGVNKVGDIIQDTAKLSVNALLPMGVKNPYTAEDFNTKAAKSLSKAQQGFDIVGTAVVGTVLATKTGQKNVDKPEQIGNSPVQNISDGGLIPNEEPEQQNNVLGSNSNDFFAQSNLTASQSNSTSPMLNQLVSSQPQGIGNVLGSLVGGIIGQRIGTIPAPQTAQKAAQAAFRSSAPQSLGTNPAPATGETKWYMKPMNIVGAVIVFIGFLLTIKKLFSRRR